MSYTVIPKSITTFNTGRSKPVDIYVWAYIKLCSDYTTNISHITEERLSELTNIPLRTIGRSIKRLKDANCMTVHTKILDGCKKRNSYHFKTGEQNFSLIDNSFFHKGYTPKIAGFMLLMRSTCINNTDKILWTKTKIAEEIGISRNTTTALLKECLALGLIKSIPNGYEIAEDSLKYSTINNKIKSPIYKAICDFCESQGVISPVWDKDAMSIIETRYNSIDLPPDHEMNICYQLNERCKRLPPKVTLAYFVKALGMDPQYKAVKAPKSVKVENGFPF